MLDEHGGIQWPFSDGTALGCKERRLFEDGAFFHSDAKAKLLFDSPQPPPEQTSDDFSFVLLTGRGSSAQWHTQTRTAKSPVLQQLSPKEPYVEINPADATKLGIRSGCSVRVSSPRGSIRVQARVTAIIGEGQLFIPMHFEVTNQLTFPSFDPHSRQPSYKNCAVQLSRI